MRVKDVNGKEIEIIEEFILGNVQRPVMCAGRLLRKGWSVQSKDNGLQLCHGDRDIAIQIDLWSGTTHEEARENRVMVLRGYLMWRN